MTSYPHTARDTLAEKAHSERCQRRSQGGEVPYLDKALNPFFNIHRIRLESGDELSRDLVNEVVVGHVLSILHDPDDACLRATCQTLPNASDKYSTSVWCFRSSSILSWVSFRSSVLSTFDETILILIF